MACNAFILKAHCRDARRTMHFHGNPNPEQESVPVAGALPYDWVPRSQAVWEAQGGQPPRVPKYENVRGGNGN